MDSLKNKKVALIGGSGFIGHNLALELKRIGAEVEVVDSLQVNNLLTFYTTQQGVYDRTLYLRILHERMEKLYEAGIPIEVLDARDYAALSGVLNRIKPDAIVHLAAVSHAGKSNKDPFSTFDHSLRTLENALDCARDKVEHFIYLSSSMVYGHFKSGDVNEETICEPLGIYGALKYSGEKLVIAYNQVFDLDYTIIRPSALYGERCVSRRVIQIFIENALAGKGITISGDGSDKLDFTYINDFVSGVIAALSNKNSRNQIFNITYGSSRKISDVAEILREYVPELKVEYIPKDNLTPDRGTLSVDKAKEMIGYDPQYPIDKGIPEYVKWYREIYG